MDKIGVKIGLNRLPRAVVILCEISRQACKSCEWDPCEALTQIQREDYLWAKWPVSQYFYIPLPISVPKTLRVMITSTPHRHTKKRLIKTVGAHTPCSCGYMQDGGLYFYIKDYQGNVRVVLNQANYPVEVDSYYPYGGLMAATTTEGIQPYKYGTKELDRENGLDLYDSKARMYDPAIGRTPTQDPMAEKYYSLSPYLWCAANPITFTDPTGMAVFWHNGKVIGDDGIDDQKIYVIKTTEKKFTSQNAEVAGAGLSKKRQKATIGFIKANSGNSDAFSKNSIAYDNSIEIEGNVANRQKMVDIVSSDNGSGGTSDANNREYGGYIEDGEVKAVDSGPVCYPSEYTQATINLPCGKSTFHSHPSGTFKRVLLIGTISRTVDEPAYIQPTSSLDIQNAGHHVHYVFGRGNGMVYIYNSSAIQAVIPFNRFVKPKLK